MKGGKWKQRSPEATAVGELPGSTASNGGGGREAVERRRPELAGEGAGVRRLDVAVAAAGAGPHERAEADGETRRHAVRLAAPAGCPPHGGRGRPPRGMIRGGGRAALVAAAAVAVPLRREAPVADRAAGGAPRRG